MKVIVFVFLMIALSASMAIDSDIKSCVCTRIYKPVCASNSVTYDNECEFNCAKATLPRGSADDLKIVRYQGCDQ